ncbi:MAG: hypothetical protein WBV33_04460 [Terracidiphilus sp.]
MEGWDWYKEVGREDRVVLHQAADENDLDECLGDYALIDAGFYEAITR